MSPFEASAVLLRPNLPEAYPVLIVDDDEIVRHQLGALFEEAGYAVNTAATGKEALEVMERDFCPIVVTDRQMPDMNGIELCQLLRRRNFERYVYIVMLTVRSGKAAVLAGLAAGADDYVNKTASPEELVARLEVARRIINLEQSLRYANTQNRMLASTDSLTGAYNRRYLMKYLPREYDRSCRYDRVLSVLACDIDHFKSINDAYGHDVGDEVLQAFVRRANTVLRTSSDWVARIGGEEFLIVLPETDLAGAVAIGERVRQEIGDKPILTAVGPVSVTVSIGASSVRPAWQAGSISTKDLLRTADQCLYASKDAGRDRTTGVELSTERRASDTGQAEGAPSAVAG